MLALAIAFGRLNAIIQLRRENCKHCTSYLRLIHLDLRRSLTLMHTFLHVRQHFFWHISRNLLAFRCTCIWKRKLKKGNQNGNDVKKCILRDLLKTTLTAKHRFVEFQFSHFTNRTHHKQRRWITGQINFSRLLVLFNHPKRRYL